MLDMLKVSGKTAILPAVFAIEKPSEVKADAKTARSGRQDNGVNGGSLEKQLQVHGSPLVDMRICRESAVGIG